MRYFSTLVVVLLSLVPADAVLVRCVSEGNNIVRIEYDATGENELPRAFALDITVDNGATIEEIYDYKVGDSNAAGPGFGIFPASMQFGITGAVSDWGSPDMNSTYFAEAQPGLGTSGVTIGMASRYRGRENAPLAKGILCRARIDSRNAQTVNVSVAPNIFAGGVVLEDAVIAEFTGAGCILNSSAPPPPSPPPSTTVPQPPASITYPQTSSTGRYTVAWESSAGAIAYRLDRSMNGGSWTRLYTGVETSYAETVTDGSSRYRVRAANAAGVSVWTTGESECVVSTSSPPPPSATGAFRQSIAANGLVSMEAEHFSDKTAAGGRRWNMTTSPAGFAGDGAMRAVPDRQVSIQYDYVSKSPRLDFDVNFVKTGRHYIWIRGYAAGDKDDSCHAGLGGRGLRSCDKILLPQTRQWAWTNVTMDDGARATFNIRSAGVSTVSIWMFEDGLRIDKILLTTDPAYEPSGDGPAASPQE